MYLSADSYIWRDSYKEFTCLYGGIHIRSSHISMEGFIYREEFISGVHMYRWKDSPLGRDSYKELTHIYGGIHKVSSYMSMDEFICRE